MDKFKTNAHKASQEINRMSKESYTIPTPWNHMESKQNVTILETTIQEIELYWDIKTYLRPGYSSESNEINIPVIFAKINGPAEEIRDVIDGINDSKQGVYIESEDQLFDIDAYDCDDKEINEEWIETFVFKEFSYLNQHYQKRVRDVLGELIRDKSKYFSGVIDSMDDIEIFKIISKIKTSVLKKYNVNDFQYAVPKLIVKIQDKQLSIEASTACLFLVMLGFDVVVINVDGFADIENYINKEFISVFMSKDTVVKSSPESKKISSFKKYGITAAVVAIAAIVGSFGVNSILKNMDDSEPLEVSEEVNTSKVEEKVNQDDKKLEIKDNDYVEIEEDNGFTFNDGELFRIIETRPGLISESITSVNLFAAYDKEYEEFRNMKASFFYDNLNNDKIKPGLWIYTADTYDLVNGAENKTYILSSTSKYIVDGTKDNMSISIGSKFKVDFYSEKMFGSYRIFPELTDEFNNVLRPYVDRGNEYDEISLEYIITNESGFNESVMISVWEGIDFLQDGDYTISVADRGIGGIVDIAVASEVYNIKNGVITKVYKENNKTEVSEVDVVINCEIGDLVLINLKEIFFDKDNERLHISQPENLDYLFNEEGYVWPYYAIQITNETLDTMTLWATDGKSNPVNKKIDLIIN